MRGGIYIHIPFCSYKCPYCDFFSVAGKENYIRDYIKAVLKEAQLREGQLSKPETLYLGGGTPSLLSPEYIEFLLEGLDNILDLSEVSEITLEANPESLSYQKLKGFRKAGVNRLSIGVQSFTEKGLSVLGRKHTAEDSARAFLMARDAGFENINLDLIWGWHGQTRENLLTDLQKVRELSPEHLSAYLLTYYSTTEMGKALKNGLLKPTDEDKIAELYDTLCTELRGEGLVHYEISNWAREGRECIHNLLYWSMEPFLGLGSGAWGMVDGVRYGNIKNIERYIELISRGDLPEYTRAPVEEEERIMLGLRTSKGIEKYNVRIPEHLRDFFERVENRIRIKEEMWLLSNEIISEVLVYNSNLNKSAEVCNG